MWSRHFHLPFGGYFLPSSLLALLQIYPPVAMRRLVSGGCARLPSPGSWLLLVCFLMPLCWADAGTRLICSPLFWPPGIYLFSLPAAVLIRLCWTQCSSLILRLLLFDRDSFVALYLVTCFTVHNFTPFRALHVGHHFDITVLSHSHFAWLAKLVRKSYHQGILLVDLSVGHHNVSRSINKWVIYFFFTLYIHNVIYKNCY
jgi:hypothetical protein